MNILTKSDLMELTGLQRPAAIKRWLERQRIPYMVGADGWPRVLQALIMNRLGVKTEAPAPEPQLRLGNWQSGK